MLYVGAFTSFARGLGFSVCTVQQKAVVRSEFVLSSHHALVAMNTGCVIYLQLPM